MRSKKQSKMEGFATKLEFNAEFNQAMELLEKSDKNVFITGRAGTGKSTLLSYFRLKTKKKVVVLAPTGVAAINVSGQTIHSFFGFKPSITLAKVRKEYQEDDKNNIFKKIEVIVIDEISMVRADLLDCVDKFLRLNGKDKNKSFGGVQMIFIGDLYQLSPVVTGKERDFFRTFYDSPYFFSAKVFSQKDFEMELLELEKIYRQKDDEFIHLLNVIRNRTVEEKDLRLLNKRLDFDFVAEESDYYIYLTTTNDLADKVNVEKLTNLPGEIRSFRASISGNFSREYYPTSEILELKEEAQVMLLNNDLQGRWVNGTIARIVGFEKETSFDQSITVRLENGKIEKISPHTWKIFRFSLEKSKLVSHSAGDFTQYPLRLAFAITIHKSQGKTFDKTIIDIGSGTFAHGQMYVALSRCRTLEGIVLKKEIKKQHILMDWRVIKFITDFQYKKAEKNFSLAEKIELITKAIKENSDLNMLYLKGKDEKSRRKIKPKNIAQTEFMGYSFLGLTCHCYASGQEKIFNVARILEIGESKDE